MAVSVGDTYHQYPQRPDNSLGKLAVGAAMLMGGLGAGFGFSQAGNKTSPVSPPPASQPFEDTDTSTRLELETADGVETLRRE